MLHPKKIAFAILAVSLWTLSLCLPVFREGGAGRSGDIYGYSVLLMTFAYGIFVGIGIPWAGMNMGLFSLFVFNLLGKSSRRIGSWFAAATTLLAVVLLLLARDYPQWHWTGAGMLQVGVVPWTAAMYAIAYATSVPISGSTSNPRTA